MNETMETETADVIDQNYFKLAKTKEKYVAEVNLVIIHREAAIKFITSAIEAKVVAIELMKGHNESLDFESDNFFSERLAKELSIRFTTREVCTYEFSTLHHNIVLITLSIGIKEFSNRIHRLGSFKRFIQSHSEFFGIC